MKETSGDFEIFALFTNFQEEHCGSKWTSTASSTTPNPAPESCVAAASQECFHLSQLQLYIWWRAHLFHVLFDSRLFRPATIFGWDSATFQQIQIVQLK